MAVLEQNNRPVDVGTDQLTNDPGTSQVELGDLTMCSGDFRERGLAELNCGPGQSQNDIKISQTVGIETLPNITKEELMSMTLDELGSVEPAVHRWTTEIDGVSSLGVEGRDSIGDLTVGEALSGSVAERFRQGSDFVKSAQGGDSLANGPEQANYATREANVRQAYFDKHLAPGLSEELGAIVDKVENRQAEIIPASYKGELEQFESAGAESKFNRGEQVTDAEFETSVSNQERLAGLYQEGKVELLDSSSDLYNQKNAEVLADLQRYGLSEEHAGNLEISVTRTDQGDTVTQVSYEDVVEDPDLGERPGEAGFIITEDSRGTTRYYDQESSYDKPRVVTNRDGRLLRKHAKLMNGAEERLQAHESQSI